LKTYWMSLAILFSLIFASCGPVPPSSGNSLALTPTSPYEGATQMPTANSPENPIVPINTLDNSESTPPPPETNPFIKLAEEDLANRLHINADEIHFLKITDIDWQDITQGCTSGQKLTKGRLSGYRIWLEASNRNYVYHVGLDNAIYLCPD
jgi:hypothetical protein